MIGSNMVEDFTKIEMAQIKTILQLSSNYAWFVSNLNYLWPTKKKRCVFLLFYEVLLVESVALESVALSPPLSLTCPLISPSGWSSV
jgi:hypothetical protein